MNTQEEKFLTKENLKERGWTDGLISILKPQQIIVDDITFWKHDDVLLKEEFVTFKNFNNIEEFNNTQIEFLSKFEKETEAGIKYVESISTELNKHNCLLNNIGKYNPLKNIVHFVSDFEINENSSFTLFTDGSFRRIGKQIFSNNAGWIIDNQTKKIIVEFSNVETIKKNANQKIPKNFELNGIQAGVKLINTLGLKNVKCYTDCISEATVISLALNGFGKNRLYELQDIYNPIIKILQESNSSISWIPREFNTHADELTKISGNVWFNQFKKDFMDSDSIQNNNYQIDRKKEFFFNHDKVKYSSNKKLNNNPIVLYHGIENFDFIFIYHIDTKSIELIKQEPVDFSHIKESLPKSVKNIKKNHRSIHNILKFLQENNGDYNLSLHANEVSILRKLKPIESHLQEEFFELHKFLNDYNHNIVITDIEDSVKKLIVTEVKKLTTNVENINSKIKSKLN